LEPEVQLSDAAYLTALTPFEGTLKPTFSQDVFTYTMDVNYDVTTVEFAATAGENGTVKINRRSLQKAGSATSILVTVTAADKKNTSQYVIVVSRAQKPAEASTGSSEVITKSTTSSPAKSVIADSQPVIRIPSNVIPTAGVQVSSPETPAEKSQQSQTPAVPAQQQPENINRSDRNIYIIGNQMPAYLVGFLAACLCISNGMIFGIWLKIKSKNEVASSKAKSKEETDPVVSKIKKIKWLKKAK